MGKDEIERLAKVMLVMCLSKHAAGAQAHVFNVVRRLFNKTFEARNAKLAGYDINSLLIKKKIAYNDAFSMIPICWRNNAQEMVSGLDILYMYSKYYICTTLYILVIRIIFQNRKLRKLQSTVNSVSNNSYYLY